MTEAFETLFGKICLERGWATREQIVDCLRQHALSAGGGDAEELSLLPHLLVSSGILSAGQAEEIRGELGRLMETGRFEDVRTEDVRLGRLLVKAGHVTREHLLEALAQQAELARGGAPVPRIGELLLEMGHATFAAVEEALQSQRTARRGPRAPVTSRRSRAAVVAILSTAGLLASAATLWYLLR